MVKTGLRSGLEAVYFHRSFLFRACYILFWTFGNGKRPFCSNLLAQTLLDVVHSLTFRVRLLTDMTGRKIFLRKLASSNQIPQ